MKQIKNYIFSIICLSGLIWSCSTETESLDDSTFGYQYYPLAIGKVWEYRMDSILFDTIFRATKDTTISYYKEEIKDTVRSTSGELLFKIDIFHKNDSLAAWNLIGSSFILKDPYQLTKIENGLRFIKLIFPIAKNRSWNGNSQVNEKTVIKIRGEEFEAYRNWSYFYNKINQEATILNKAYTKVLEVQEADDENLAEKRSSYAKYAEGIGHIYKEQWFLGTELLDDKIAWENRAQRGVIIRQYLITHR